MPGDGGWEGSIDAHLLSDVHDDDHHDDHGDDGMRPFYLRPFYLPSLLPTGSR